MLKHLVSQGQHTVLFADEVDKINEVFKVQRRIALITDDYIYNMTTVRHVFVRREDGRMGGTVLERLLERLLVDWRTSSVQYVKGYSKGSSLIGGRRVYSDCQNHWSLPGLDLRAFL